MDRSTELLVALTSRDLSDELPVLKSRDLWTILQSSADQGTTPAALFEEAGVWERAVAPELHDLVAARLELREHIGDYVDHLRQGGIWVSSPYENDWPSRLEDRLETAAPLVLYGAGDRELIATDGIGVVGSRSLSPEGEAVARGIAAAAARAELPVVSGGARGADEIAMTAVMEAGGRAVGVLAHPLTRTMSDSWTAAALADARLCLVTPFKPDAGFSVGNAMSRNKLIYGLSRVTAVVAADHGTGGTWNGATEALDREFGTVAVWRGAGEGPGNAALAGRHGANAVSDAKDLFGVAPSAARQATLL